MSILVEQQDEQITVINDTVKEVEKDVETGYVRLHSCLQSD